MTRLAPGVYEHDPGCIHIVGPELIAAANVGDTPIIRATLIAVARDTWRHRRPFDRILVVEGDDR